LHLDEREILAPLASPKDPLDYFKSALAEPDWPRDGRRAAALRAPLMRLCARYLIEERRGSGTSLDSVAHFHLNNGARIEQLNWLADGSPKGLEQSAGIMLNYLYELENIDANHEAYRGNSEISASAQVRELIK
jgi:malonyl-CoA decarboxylase